MPYYGNESDETLSENNQLNFLSYYGAGGRDLILFGNKTGDPIGLYAVYIDGGTGNDVITGNINGDQLYAGSGDDIAYGNGGDDEVYGGGGNDALTGNEGDDSLSGGYGNDTLLGGSGTNYLDGGFGDDTLYADTGGREFMFGGGGSDLVSYENASAAIKLNLTNGNLNEGTAEADIYDSIERFKGSAFGDRMTGDGTENVFDGHFGADTLTGLGGADQLFGDSGADNLLGGVGNDYVDGESGADTIVGGAGKDYMLGGADADVFRYVALSDSTVAQNGRDQIADFAAGDRIDLSLIDANAAVTGNQTFALDTGGAFAVGEIRVRPLDGGGVVVFANTKGDAVPEMAITVFDVSALAKADFIL
jgi:Ca2+-binding RTX toxin-like protein